MLKTLTVWNFALIEHVQIDFCQGLNILTGETGAGKSILIDAVGVVLGHRTASDTIRHGSDWLRVEAVFDIDGQEGLRQLLAEQDIVVEDEDLIVTRQITKSGKNTIRINGCQVTLAVLKLLGRFLIDIHGQHENQALLQMENQFALLEHYDPAIKLQFDVYSKLFVVWRDLADSLRQKELDSREYARRIDMLKWQADEIEAASLKENEDESLEAEIKVLSNSEKIAAAVRSVHQIFEYGVKGSGGGVLGGLIEAKKHLSTVIRYDSRMENALKMLEEALCQLQECSYEVRDYGEGLEYSPERLNELQSRMDVIDKLRKKYGATIADVLAHYEQVKAELAEIENYDQIIEALKNKLQATEKELYKAAEKLTELRGQAAQQLSAAIEKHLTALGMPRAKFSIVLSPTEKLGRHGLDQINMMFSANPGEVPKDVQKVASGGELSRIALAIKAVSAERDEVGVMIFDEIDTGIGGKTAQMVAERIAMVAIHKQVLCITHLPQIACMADAHLYIDKQAHADKTVTQIRKLSTSEQINELARMFSGMDVTVASLDNALEMLNNAKMKKEKYKIK